jgi:serine protease Do
MTTDVDGAFAAVAAKLRASTMRVHDEGGRGSGSGVLWDARGLIVTNAHVVRGRTATIETGDGRKHAARVERRDAGRDLAALRLEAPGDVRGLVPATVRDSQSVVPGELAIAAGNPLGFVGAVTAGLVHRCNARWVIADVRLAPGNSGGPLADAQGRVVGINSMVANGLALAVPSAAVAAFLEAPAAATVPRRLGVALRRVRVGGGTEALLIVGSEPGSVAERSGLLLGDVVLDALPQLAGAASLEVVRAGARLRVPLAWAAPGRSHAA